MLVDGEIMVLTIIKEINANIYAVKIQFVELTLN